jgi:hypothetical protein
MCRRLTILNFVIMTSVLLEQHRSHDHEVGGWNVWPIWG